jgi:cytochrome bd-type quinol oxidase subunit 2
VLARWWHATIAVAVVAALVVQVVVAVRVTGTPHDTTAGLVRGSSLPGRIVRVFSFFTILSNVLCAVVSAQLARDPGRDGPRWRPFRLAALFGITVTGIVYSTVLARIHQPNGAAETFVNDVVHYLVPVLVVVGWLAFGPRPRIDRRTLVLSLLLPLAWFAYTLVRGAIWHWYPYPFLDVPSHGYFRVIVNAILVTAVLAAVAGLLGWGDHRLSPRPRRNRSG